MISLPAAAKLLGISSTRLRLLCTQRRIPYAKRIGRFWALPDQPRIKPPASLGRPPQRRPKRP